MTTSISIQNNNAFNKDNYCQPNKDFNLLKNTFFPNYDDLIRKDTTY